MSVTASPLSSLGNFIIGFFQELLVSLELYVFSNVDIRMRTLHCCVLMHNEALIIKII